MSKRSKRAESRAVIDNNRRMSQYLALLQTIFCNSYDIGNLPDYIDPNRAMTQLFESGLSVFYLNSDYDRFIMLPATGAQRIDLYGNPVSYVVMGANGFRDEVPADDCVPIFLSRTRFNPWYVASDTAFIMSQIKRVIEIQIQKQKSPIIVSGSENQLMAFKRVISSAISNEPYCLVDNNFDLGTLQYISTTETFSAEKLWQLYRSVLDEYLEICGLDCIAVKKRERLIVDEAESNDMMTYVNRRNILNSLNYSVKRINDKYGLDLYVEYIGDTYQMQESLLDSLMMQEEPVQEELRMV